VKGEKREYQVVREAKYICVGGRGREFAPQGKYSWEAVLEGRTKWGRNKGGGVGVLEGKKCRCKGFP